MTRSRQVFVVPAGLIAETEMRVSTKLGVAALIIWMALRIVVAGVAPPRGLPADSLAIVDSVIKLEATISVNLLSAASLVTGIIALIWAGYRRLWPEQREIAITSAAVAARRQIGLKAEFLIVSGLVAALFAVNLVTAEIYPMAWGDEAGYADPAINLALGNGLTSSMWAHGYWGKFWYSYPPFYQFLLAPWVAWSGVNLTFVRGFNDVLISGAAIALWHYTVRSGFFPSMAGRIIVVLLPLLGYGVSFSYRGARPDTLCILLAGLALNASLLSRPRWRAAALVAVGALAAWTALQLVAFAVVLAVLVGVWWPRQAMTIFLPVGVGMGLGFIALFGLYVAEGSLYGFLASTFGSFHTITGQIAQLIVMHDPRSPHHFRELPSLLLAVVFEDRSSVFLFTAAILLLISFRRATDAIAFKAARFAVTASFGIPILTELAGQYWLYYTWMGFLTVGIALVVSAETSPRSSTLLPTRGLAFGCIGLAFVVGLPLQLTKAYGERGARDYDMVRTYVRSAGIAVGDWVFIAPEAYFAVAELGGVPVIENYASGPLAPSIPDDQRRRIKLLIVHPDAVKGAIDRLGGSWIPSAPAFSPPGATRLTWGEVGDAYQFVAYRRE
jgi:hypothetical protein